MISLQSLYLSNNQLTSIPPELGQLTDLEESDLSNNQLTSIPPELGQLTSLQILNLSNNQLTATPPELGQLTNLLQFYLDNNQLITIPPELGQLTNLKQLTLITILTYSRSHSKLSHEVQRIYCPFYENCRSIASHAMRPNFSLLVRVERVNLPCCVRCATRHLILPSQLLMVLKLISYSYPTRTNLL